MDHPLEPGRNMSVMVTSFLGYANYVIREITLTNVSEVQNMLYTLELEKYWPPQGTYTPPGKCIYNIYIYIYIYI